MISPDMVTNAAREVGLPPPQLQLRQDDDPRLFKTLYRFCAAVETGATVLEQQSWFTACMHIFLHHAEAKPPTLVDTKAHCAVERAKRYLEDRFTEPVGLDELAALTGLSRFHLVRIFAKYVGVPPHAYQIKVRIERSRALLEAGTSPVSAAVDVGFADQSHFTRHFRRVMGVTPSAYARARDPSLRRSSLTALPAR